MRFAVDCHPIYFHLLDESLDGRVDLGTRVVRWPRRSGNWFSTVQNIWAMQKRRWYADVLPGKKVKINSELKTCKVTKYIY